MAANALGARRLPGKFYELPDGRIVTNRQFQKLRVEKNLGVALSNERYAKVNATMKAQVAASRSDLPAARKRELAMEAARIGLRKPPPRSQESKRMFTILRRELDIAPEDFTFVWGERTSN